jgi:hypothetical protein
MESSLLSLIPVLAMMIMLPVLCYEDWTKRALGMDSLAMYAGINMVFLIPLYMYGIYGWEEVAITVMLVVLFFLTQGLPWSRAYFHGDDMFLMWLISIFCVVNPLHPNAGDLAVTTLIFLVPVMFAFFIFLFITTIAKNQEYVKYGILNFVDIARMTGNRFPLVIPIAVAFYLAVLL